MRFEIKRAKNGYILQCDSDEDPMVFQELSEEIMDEVDVWANFLWELTDQYGPSTSRHSKKRVRIKVEPGDKFQDHMIRHIVIVQFRKGAHEDYRQLLEETKPFIKQIPGVMTYEIFENDSKYVPETNISFGVEIQFENQAALDVFMQHPKHYEANALFEKYLADPPYMVLTHGM
jgi:quinol monooxygenase YgiN